MEDVDGADEWERFRVLGVGCGVWSVGCGLLGVGVDLGVVDLGVVDLGVADLGVVDLGVGWRGWQFWLHVRSQTRSC